MNTQRKKLKEIRRKDEDVKARALWSMYLVASLWKRRAARLEK